MLIHERLHNPLDLQDKSVILDTSAWLHHESAINLYKKTNMLKIAISKDVFTILKMYL